MLTISSCCGRSLKTGATIVGIFYLVVSVCFLIYCIVNVISPPKEAHGSLLESSSLYQILPKRIRDKLSVLSTQEKDEVYKSLPNAVIELQEATSVSVEVTGLAIAQLIITAFHVLSNVSLLIGVWKEDGNLVFTWLWTQVVLFFVSCGFALTLVLVCISSLNILGECLLVACIVLYLGISLYCFMVVNSFYMYLYQSYAEQKQEYDKSTLQLV